MTTRTLVVAVLLPLAYAAQPNGSGVPETQNTRVELRHAPAEHQVVVSIVGQPFTTYHYGPDFPDKTAFYPVLAPNGARVNREYPMVPGVTGESADHPHHQSMFFAYDEVNGTNFWNSSPTGRRIEQTNLRVDANALTAQLAWKDKDGGVVLEETKRVTFGGDTDVSWMDHDITLAATRVPVRMGDTKEGAFAIRLNDTLKEQGGSGRYINAEGLETETGVWGRTSNWVAIRGTVRDGAVAREVTVAIFAAPSGHNAPPYWHARAYGLFAVNPFGRKSFDPAAPERVTRLAVGERLRVGFRLAVYRGQVSTARLAQDFAGMR